MTPEHIAFAKQLARWKHRSLRGDLDDMIGDALLGLVKAEKDWKPGGKAFLYYARIRILGEIIDGHRKRNQWNRRTLTGVPTLLPLNYATDNATVERWDTLDVEAEYIAAERFDELMAVLTDKQREAVEYRMEGKHYNQSHAEIERQASNLYAARKKLRPLCS